MKYEERLGELELYDIIKVQRDRFYHTAILYRLPNLFIEFLCTGAEIGKFEAYCGALNSRSHGSRAGNIEFKSIEDLVQENEWCVDNFTGEARSRGLRRSDVKEIESRINRLRDKSRKRTLNYHVKDFNCEHFVTFVKYGTGFSVQAEKGAEFACKLTATATAAVASGLMASLSSISNK